MRRNPCPLGLLLALGILAGACSKDPSAPAPATPSATPAALQFDGFDDFVQVPASTSLAGVGAGDFTWEIRFRRSRVRVREDILTKKDTLRDSEHDAAIVIENTGEVSAFLRETPFSAQTILTSSSQVDTGWVRVAMVRSRGLLRLYVNGQLEKTGTASFSVASTGPFRIGANRFNNAGADARPVFPFAGHISEVRIWNVARTETEIGEAAVRCVPRGTAGLVADFRFNEGSGTVLSDASGTGNNGQLRNGPAWAPGDRSCA
jgi:hypothetical protein